jgi:hypothetical protein
MFPARQRCRGTSPARAHSPRYLGASAQVIQSTLDWLERVESTDLHEAELEPCIPSGFARGERLT